MHGKNNVGKLPTIVSRNVDNTNKMSYYLIVIKFLPTKCR